MHEVYVPRENVNDDSVIIRRIHLKSGEAVVKNQLILEIETSKTNIEIESPVDGVIKHQLEEGSDVKVGDLLFRVGDSEDEIITIPNNESDNFFKKSDVKISNAAQKRAKELEISVESINLDWITVDDVNAMAGISKKINIEKVWDSENFKRSKYIITPFQVKSFTKRKQAEVRNLEMGEHHATSSTIGIDIKIKGRRMVVAPFLFRDSISDLIVFEASKLLRQYPELNSSYLDTKTYGMFEEINFGLSFDSGANLKVLGIKSADKISLLDLQNEIEGLLFLYESNKQVPTEILTNSTVTLTDLSRTEASFMLPLINGYQSLILGVVKKDVNIFSIYATFDHRVSEGLAVTKFLSDLRLRILSHYADGILNSSLICYACEKGIVEEISFGNRGFLKIALPSGDDACLCRNCFEGW
jgi:pyruvate/2-oxoglutarate dehydrogenase complex dihydrolipoamide acyltransferase (E2) component